MLSFELNMVQIQSFLLIFFRIAAIVWTLPVLDNRSIPVLWKAGLAFSMSILLFPMVTVNGQAVFNNIVYFIIGAVSEALLGVLIGLSLNLVLSGIQLAGQLAGFQMGFAISTVFDPMTGTQASVIAQLYYLIAVLVFLAVDAHHIFIRGVVQSFQWLPVFGFGFGGATHRLLTDLSAGMFVIAVKAGAPVIAALLLSTAALGLIARIVPQMNVFFVAMPLQIFIGLVFIALSLIYLVSYLEGLYNDTGIDIFRLIKNLQNP